MIDSFLDPCNYCPHKNGEYCSFYNDFIHKGIDFDLILWDCSLPDFQFDGEVIKWS